MIHESPRTRRRIDTEEFLDAARRILSSDGLDAVTMPRIASDVGCAVGAAYRHFPSKEALLAVLQRRALERLVAGYEAAQPDWDEAIAAEGLAPGPAALTRAGAFLAFFVDAEAALPDEYALLRALIGDPRVVLPDDLVGEVLPTVLAILTTLTGLLERTVSAGALSPGDTMERASVLVSIWFGVLVSAKLTRAGMVAATSQNTSDAAARALCLGWGASPADLDAAFTVVESLRADQTLIPKEIRA